MRQHLSRLVIAMSLVAWMPLVMYGSTELARPIPAAEAALIRGGVDCYVPGTANCPPATDCSTYACTQVGALFICKTANTGSKQSQQGYDYAALTGDPGNTGITPQPAIMCLDTWTCSGCDASNNCEYGQANGKQSAQRTPTIVNTNSPICNKF